MLEVLRRSPLPESTAGARRTAVGLASGYSLTTGFLSTPILSISTSTTSPASRNCGGLRLQPTPAGVPVTSTSPGARSKMVEQ